MKNIAEILLKNEVGLSIFSNKHLIIILYCLNKENSEQSLENLSSELKLKPENLKPHIEYLIKIGFVEKTDKLDKSTKPTFINTYYKVNRGKLSEIMDETTALLNCFK